MVIGIVTVVVLMVLGGWISITAIWKHRQDQINEQFLIQLQQLHDQNVELARR